MEQQQADRRGHVLRYVDLAIGAGLLGLAFVGVAASDIYGGGSQALWSMITVVFAAACLDLQWLHLRSVQAISTLTTDPRSGHLMAADLGYSAQSSMSRVVRRWTGVSPRAMCHRGQSRAISNSAPIQPS